ncbi:MAG: hypothetical protein NZM09_12485 [Ignavibacterium sp.]|nr:hypothetical protein [Ignavibacterium sp.]MDW8376493.1 hypothetical protein [Ignavibacteriales bacterium]
MILDKIKYDIEQEFYELKNSISNRLRDDFDIDAQKDFLKNHIPNEIIVKSEILLDTLLNYLMETAINELDKLDVEIQNDFFNQDFRNKIREWVKQTENKLELTTPELLLADPRWRQGVINGGTAFIIGTAVTVFVFDPTKVIWAIVTGLVTIISAVYLFKKGYEKAEPKARSIIRSDVEKFIENAEKQVTDWLETVATVFSEEFKDFCNSRSINIKGIL